ncbi:MAG: hypothetical protein WBW88_03670 [Rhodothermales bacterium]
MRRDFLFGIAMVTVFVGYWGSLGIGFLSWVPDADALSLLGVAPQN